jgi:hypothetical protein
MRAQIGCSAAFQTPLNQFGDNLRISLLLSVAEAEFHGVRAGREIACQSNRLAAAVWQFLHPMFLFEFMSSDIRIS